MPIKEKYLSYLLFNPKGRKPNEYRDSYGIEKLQASGNSSIYTDKEAQDLYTELTRMDTELRVYSFKSFFQVPFTFGFNRGYGVEHYFLKIIPRSLLATRDPKKARAYVVPATPYMYYVAVQVWMFFTRFLRGIKSTGPKGNNPFLQKRRLIEKPLKAVLNKVAATDSFSRHHGADFIFFSSKLGTECLENVNADLLNNGILVVNSADSKRGPFDFTKDVSSVCMKDYKIPKYAFDIDAFDRPFQDREHFTYYAGMIYGWRRAIEKLKTEQCHWVIGHLPFKQYLSNYANSKFYFHFPGSSEWSPRLFEGMFFGAIPVVFYDKYTLPFSDLLDWSQFAVLIHIDQVADTYQILEAISPEEWGRMQLNLKTALKHFCYHKTPVKGDAFYLTMYSIFRRIENRITD